MEQLRLCVHNPARLKFIHRFALCMHGQAYPFLNAPPRSDDNQRIDLNICVNRNRGESRVSSSACDARLASNDSQARDQLDFYSGRRLSRNTLFCSPVLGLRLCSCVECVRGVRFSEESQLYGNGRGAWKGLLFCLC